MHGLAPKGKAPLGATESEFRGEVKKNNQKLYVDAREASDPGQPPLPIRRTQRPR
jgi:hypothetical protein